MELLDGRYELTGLLGRGGMAEVHRAHDRLLDREVAVKVLLDPAAGDAAAARQRFEAEARLLAQLDHPALVTLLGAGTSGGRPFFVMELVDAGTFAQHLVGAPLDPALVAGIGSQVAEGLAHAHAYGVVHRDVKPGNVLLGTDGRVRLADFGIARVDGDTAGLTGSGTTVGTVAYLAPEQVRGERVTSAVDVYALGLMLLEALTGVRAYPGTATESAFARLHHNPAIPLSLPHGWPRLLAAMTATDPAERPAAAAAAEGIRALGAGRPTTVALSSAGPAGSAVDAPRTQSVPVAPRARRVPRYRLAAAAVVAVLASVAGGAALTPDAAVSDEQPASPAPPRTSTPAPPAPAPAPTREPPEPATSGSAVPAAPRHSAGDGHRTDRRATSHGAARAPGRQEGQGAVQRSRQQPPDRAASRGVSGKGRGGPGGRPGRG